MQKFEATVFFGGTYRTYTVLTEQRSPNSDSCGSLYFRDSSGKFICFPAANTVIKELELDPEDEDLEEDQDEPVSGVKVEHSIERLNS
jgi:hypothetical protein